MDKKKTGSLIKEARINKNYTQSELGDLLGVTNKAVSRWENGDSFPDVGVLENLSAILDLRIQDIVTGETEKKRRGSSYRNCTACKVTAERKKQKADETWFHFYTVFGLRDRRIYRTGEHIGLLHRSFR